MGKAKLIALEVGQLGTNCYLVAAAGATECVVVDPGGDAESIVARLKKERLTPALVLITHSHFDHIGGLADLLQAYPGLTAAAHAECAARMADPEDNLSYLGGVSIAVPAAERQLADGETFTAAGLEIQARLLEGHAPGHLVYHLPAEKLLFSGDALFYRGIGRSDLPGGSEKVLLAGLNRLLNDLPGETRALPGHGPATTLAEERDENPYLG